ncbi:hypothetical protein ACFC4G_36945 [Streptomyces sp. NPDC056002]|uniref:hypothetical protein n=1 Tax=unclassified Streptomyces TaxID=2593676 RepID=UPI0030C98F55
MLVSGAALAVAAGVSAAPPARAAGRRGQVVPVAWRALRRGPARGADAERLHTILLNANRFALTTWYTTRFGDQGEEGPLSLGGTAENNIRPVAAEAFALAASLATGAYDSRQTGVTESRARAVAVRLLTSVAGHHRVNEAGGWGNVWQSALWAAMNGFAGWLLWDSLPDAARERLRLMVEAEADRFVGYQVPYWKDRDGVEQTPGDSKAEENAWNAMVLQVATAMMPEHPRWSAWQDKNLELMISAFARPSDLTSRTVLHGRALGSWLDGWNMEEDGLVINHGIIHPDYMATAVQNTHAVLTCALAGRPAPRAALHNVDVVYAALVDREFTSPPFQAPGGTMYVRGSHELYFPQGTDWGVARRMDFVAMDVITRELRLDRAASAGGAYWEPLHAGRALWMQQRNPDGATYTAGDADTYAGREEWVAMHAAWSHLTRWLVHQDAVRVTNKPY